MARWLSCDPHSSKYSSLSPYNYVANNPILFIDPDGNRILIHYLENGVSEVYEYNGSNTYIGTNKYVQNVVASLENAKIKVGAETAMEVVSSDKIINIAE